MKDEGTLACFKPIYHPEAISQAAVRLVIVDSRDGTFPCPRRIVPLPYCPSDDIPLSWIADTAKISNQQEPLPVLGDLDLIRRGR